MSDLRGPYPYLRWSFGRPRALWDHNATKWDRGIWTTLDRTSADYQELQRRGYVPARPVADVVALPPIYPAPVRDWRMFDFTATIGDPTIAIDEVFWYCVVNQSSPVDDPNPTDRLIGQPTIAGQITTHMFGDAVEDVDYIIAVEAKLPDGRVFVVRGTLASLSTTIAPPEPLTGNVVPFDYQYWLRMFPEFKPQPPVREQVSEEAAQAFWSNACMILRNDSTSPVQDLEQRRDLLMLLTSHLAALFGGPNGGGGFGPQMTGVTTSKSVDGVSIGSSGMFPGVTGTQAWYMLTRYGMAYWFKVRAFRLFHYVPGPQRSLVAPWYSWPYQVGGLY